MNMQNLPQEGTAVQQYKHPTPAEIGAAITIALCDDYDKHPIGGDVPCIPSRVHRIVREAIGRACDAKAAQS